MDFESQFPVRRGKRIPAFLVASGGGLFAVGLPLLMLPWRSGAAAMSYAACRSDFPTWVQCVTDHSPALPFLLVLSGAASIAAGVWLLRR